MINEYGKSNIEELTKCLFTNKCIVYDNEYYFTFNNERVKADECFYKYYGKSYCKYNNIEYTNVSYETIYKGYHYENSNIYKVTYFFIFMFMFTLLYKFVLSKLDGE